MSELIYMLMDIHAGLLNNQPNETCYNWFNYIDGKLSDYEFDHVDKILEAVTEEGCFLHQNLNLMISIFMAAAPKQCRSQLPHFDGAVEKYRQYLVREDEKFWTKAQADGLLKGFGPVVAQNRSPRGGWCRSR